MGFSKLSCLVEIHKSEDLTVLRIVTDRILSHDAIIYLMNELQFYEDKGWSYEIISQRKLKTGAFDINVRLVRL